MKPVRVGLCGLGTVGSGTVNVLQRNSREISARAGTDIVLQQIGARRDNPGCDTTGIAVTRDIFAVARNPEVDVLVELIGGTATARELVESAIQSGKHVVTANKALIAEHGNELFKLAEARGVNIAFEAAVAGGIPIIKALREGLSGNRIQWLAGIINGTGNFILTEMKKKGREFEDVLKEAQQKGYAEADPTFDVEGIDAAHKLVILAAIAFGIPLHFESIFTEGISAVEPQDLQFAQELGYTIKHLGIARQGEAGVELRVHPTLIPRRRLLANVDGVMNAVLVKGDAVGPTLYYGAGAGAEPTASAVIADLVDLARSIEVAPASRVAHLGFNSNALADQPILPMEEITTAYYLRMIVEDHPGVLNQITGILSDSGISIEAVIRKEGDLDMDIESEMPVPLVLLTHRAQEKKLLEAVGRIEELKVLLGEITRIRVETLI